MPRGPFSSVQGTTQDSKEFTTKQPIEGNTQGLTTQKKALNMLTESQRSRLFACICVARHLHGASDSEDTFTQNIYETTLDLLAPHKQRLEFKTDPTYQVVNRIWTDFIKTGIITGSRAARAKQVLKGSRSNKRETSEESGSSLESSSTKLLKYGFTAFLFCLLTPFILSFINAQDSSGQRGVDNHGPLPQQQLHEQRVKAQVDTIKRHYQGHLKPKQLNTIWARMNMMNKELSILLLLGRSHDSQCKADQTHCLATSIANITRYPQYGYIDASDPHLESRQMIGDLSSALDEKNDIIMIDSLQRLPGNEVMNLFQFIDRDEFNKRRKGLLLLVLYANPTIDDTTLARMRDAEAVEKILFPEWSKYVRSDTLTSVISRISGTIVRVQ